MPDNDYLFLNIFVKRFNRHHPSMQTVYSIATVLEYPPYFPELKHNILLLKIQHLSLRMRKNQTGIQLETWSVQFSFFLFSFFYILYILDKNLWSDMLFIYIGLVVTQKCGPIFTLCDGQRVGGCSNYWQAKFHVLSPNSAFDCLILLTLG